MKSSGNVGLAGVPGIGRAFSVNGVLLLALLAIAFYAIHAANNARLQQAW